MVGKQGKFDIKQSTIMKRYKQFRFELRNYYCSYKNKKLGTLNMTVVFFRFDITT